jgi:hypothetical protein
MSRLRTHDAFASASRVLHGGSIRPDADVFVGTATGTLMRLRVTYDDLHPHARSTAESLNLVQTLHASSTSAITATAACSDVVVACHDTSALSVSGINYDGSLRHVDFANGATTGSFSHTYNTRIAPTCCDVDQINATVLVGDAVGNVALYDYQSLLRQDSRTASQTTLDFRNDSGSQVRVRYSCKTTIRNE